MKRPSMVVVLLGALVLPASLRAQSGWRAAGRVEVEALDPDDPFKATLAFGGWLGGLNGANAIGLRALIQSEGPSYGSAIGHGRRYILVSGEHYFQPDDRLRRQLFLRLGAGAVFQTQVKTEPVVEVGIGLRYILNRRFNLLGSLGDAIVFEQAQSFSCSDGFIVTTCTVPNKAQSNFGLAMMLEAKL